METQKITVSNEPFKKLHYLKKCLKTSGQSLTITDSKLSAKAYNEKKPMHSICIIHNLK